MVRPRHDPPPKGQAATSGVPILARLRRFGRKPGPKRPGKDDGGGEPCPVKPDRPLNLSGGAAAALEFDA